MNELKWSNQVVITSDYEMHIAGFTVFIGNLPVYDHAFYHEIMVTPGNDFIIDLTSVSFAIL